MRMNGVKLSTLSQLAETKKGSGLSVSKNEPKLTLNIRSPATNKSESLSKAAEKKRAHTETMDEAWARIFSMKNSEADARRLREVKDAIDAGKFGREAESASKRFSKAEALRLWRVLDEMRAEERLRKMVEETPDNYWLITDEAKLEEFLEILKNEKEIVFDVETTGARDGEEHQSDEGRAEETAVCADQPERSQTQTNRQW